MGSGGSKEPHPGSKEPGAASRDPRLAPGRHTQAAAAPAAAGAAPSTGRGASTERRWGVGTGKVKMGRRGAAAWHLSYLLSYLDVCIDTWLTPSKVSIKRTSPHARLPACSLVSSLPLSQIPCTISSLASSGHHGAAAQRAAAARAAAGSESAAGLGMGASAAAAPSPLAEVGMRHPASGCAFPGCQGAGASIPRRGGRPGCQWAAWAPTPHVPPCPLQPPARTTMAAAASATTARPRRPAPS